MSDHRACVLSSGRGMFGYLTHRKLNVTVPFPVLNNGSLYAHVFLGPKGKSPMALLQQSSMASVTVPLTKYLVPSAATFNLVTGDYEVQDALLQLNYIQTFKNASQRVIRNGRNLGIPSKVCALFGTKLPLQCTSHLVCIQP